MYKHTRGFPKHSEERCLDLLSEDQTPRVSNARRLCFILARAERRGGEIRWGEKREKWEKWRQRWGTQLGLHIPEVYVCECALQYSERERVGTPSECYRHNPEFFIFHHCSTAPSPPLSWQILKLHAWPRDLKEVMTRRRNPWQRR